MVLPTNISAGQAGHASIHNATNAKVNEIEDRTNGIEQMMSAVSEYKPLFISAIDESDIAQPLTLGVYTLLPVRLSVPPDRRGLLMWGAHFLCTGSGAGIAGVGVGETTSGSGTPVHMALAAMSGTYTATGVYLPYMGSVSGTMELEPSPEWRHFRMQGAAFRDSGTFAASVSKSKSGSGQHDRAPYMRAVLL